MVNNFLLKQLCLNLNFCKFVLIWNLLYWVCVYLRYIDIIIFNNMVQEMKKIDKNVKIGNKI